MVPSFPVWRILASNALQHVFLHTTCFSQSLFVTFPHSPLFYQMQQAAGGLTLPALATAAALEPGRLHPCYASRRSGLAAIGERAGGRHRGVRGSSAAHEHTSGLLLCSALAPLYCNAGKPHVLNTQNSQYISLYALPLVLLHTWWSLHQRYKQRVASQCAHGE